MNRLTNLFIGCFLSTIFCFAQEGGETAMDTVNSAQQKELIERVDTLVRYTRKQFYQNNYDQTIEVGQQTLDLAKQIDEYESIFRVYSLMGNAFLKIEDTLQAKKIFLEAITEAEMLNDTTRNITTARIDLGNLYLLEEKPDEAIKQYKSAIPLAEKLKDTTHLFILNYNLSELSLDAERIDDATYFVNKTNSYVTNLRADAYHAVANLVTGRLSRLKNEPKEAINYFKESMKLAESAGYTDALIETSEVYADVEIELGNLTSAIALLKKADTYKSEKYKADKIQAIETTTAKFKLDQYEQELLAANLQNEVDQQKMKRDTTYLWIKIASGILLLSAIILFLSYRRRKKLLKSLIKKNKQYVDAKELSEKQVRAKNLLFSNITHELRTPMYGIIGISSLLQDDEKLAHQAENLNSLKFSADYLLSLVNNVLQLTQLEAANSARLKQTDFNIRELVASVVESSKFLNTTEPNTYTINVDPKIPNLLNGDDIKLSQVLMNLISNASKFTENGTITIDVNRIEDVEEKCTIQFYIKDTGLGMSTETISQVYEEFSQTSSNYQHQGTGLGLNIVKKILHLHNSELKLESEINKGTAASFTISYDLTEGVGFKSESTENKPNVLDHRKILVVDDNKINRLVTSKTLEKRGAVVLTAEGGEKAVEIAKAESLDLILMDINMPGMNGFEASEAIRSFDTSIPIIALTAVEEEKIIIENTLDLLNDFILKPYKPKVFIDTILRHLPS